eukprot:TRINITY_DN31201_c0_g1_i2.p1 TRINITY_DN31201_c0_g1~~TRINITY_DN31201_c0_g1_i2.p1  ORF type:complete len:480 (-),score=80.33 TRINITY_DN31201_c0_g1_i2:147-1586(-)
MYERLEGEDTSSDAVGGRFQRPCWAAAVLVLGCAFCAFGFLCASTSSSEGRAEDAEMLAAKPDEAKTNSSEISSTEDSDVEASLIVMRHCVRGVSPSGVKAPENGTLKYTNVDDYSDKPWPEFQVPIMNCVERGADIIEAQGRFFGKHGKMPFPVRIVADTMSRNNVTKVRFMRGLQLPEDQCTSTSNHDLFEQTAASLLRPRCLIQTPGQAAMVQSAETHMRDNPAPKEYREYLQKLYSILGKGAAGDWTDLGCSVSYNGFFTYPVGTCQIAADVMEYLLMEWGNGTEVAWGRMDDNELTKLTLLHSWWFFNWWAPSEVYKLFGASLAQELAAKVAHRSKGTDLYVGHDSNIMMLKGALGLFWEPSPFAANATIPGCMLRFDRTGRIITASYWYPASFRDLSGKMLQVPAIFASTGSSRISVRRFKRLLEAGSLEACAMGLTENTDKMSSGEESSLAQIAGGIIFILIYAYCLRRRSK